jgi:hypothetical protein
MNNLKFSLFRLGTGVVLACVPFLAGAVVLGELTTESRLGEPFRARIPFVTEHANEELSPGCVSLRHPTLPATDSLPFLKGGQIRLKHDQILISSLRPVGDPAIRLALDVSCSPTQWQRREYTVLLDPRDTEHTPKQEASVPGQPEDQYTKTGFPFSLQEGDTLANVSRKIYPKNSAMQRRLIAKLRNINAELAPLTDNQPIGTATPIRFPDLRSVPYRPATQPHTPAPAALPAPLAIGGDKTASSDKSDDRHGYCLRLSSADLDLSNLAKVTEKERQALRDRLAILDSDDLMADYLSLRHRMAQMEIQVAEIRLKLAGTLTARSPPTATTLPALKRTEQSWLPSPTQPWLWTGAIGLAVGLAFSVLLTRWLRRDREDEMHANLQSAFGFTSQQPTAPDLEEAAKSLVDDDESTVLMEDDSSGIDHDTLYDTHSIFAPADKGIALNEADSIIDEVNLYLAYGWHKKAIDLLKLHIEKDPKEVQAWLMLFQIYRREEMKEEYAQLARHFREVFEDKVLWHTVQKIGREFDADNPVYSSSDQ